MSSSPRNTGPSNRYGSDEYGKRRKSFYPSSTRRDFKSSSSSPQGLSTAAVPGPSLNKPLRTEAAASSEIPARARYRDSPAAGVFNSPQGSRSNSYTKDSRYSSNGSKYPYNSSYHQDRASGAYGSFSSAKRAENEAPAGHSTARDASSRDMVNGTSRPERPGFSRDPRQSWRSERPKPHTANGERPVSSSRFNPNSIPLSSRGSNGLSSSVSHDYKKERYDYDDSSSARWKSYSAPRDGRGERLGPSGPTGRYNTPKERIRSSGLTNSVGTSKRSDSYYPHRSYKDRYGRGGYDDDDDTRGTSTTSSRELNAKSASPSSESYYETGQSGESSMNTYDGRHDEYEEHDGEDDDEEEDDEEEEDENEEEEEEEEVEEEEEEVDDTTNEKVSPVTEEKLDTVKTAFEEENEGPQEAQKPTSLEEQSFDGALPEQAIEYPDGCMYPQTKLEAAYEQIRLGFPEDTDYLKKAALCESSGTDFKRFPFFSFNLRKFSHFYDTNLKIVQQNKRALKKKQLALLSEYRRLSIESDRRRAYMEEQLKVLHPAEDESRKELEAIDIRVKLPEPEVETAPIEAPVASGRRGRRHGDSVTTEAEFQEILKSLKNVQDEDPIVRARHVAAEIPDLILDPLEKEAFKFMDSNNIVHDKSRWEERLLTDFETNFSEIEHDMFCEAFCRAPKRFGEISRYMGGLRTFNECVMHYYITKKAVNYKFLVAQYKKKTASKVVRRKKKVKAKSLTSNEGLEAPTSVVSEEVQPLDVIPHHVEETKKDVGDGSGGAFERKRNVIESEESVRKRLRLEDGNSPDDFKKGQATSAPHQGMVKESSNPSALAEVAQGLDILPSPNNIPPVVSTDPGDGSNFVDEKKLLKHISSYWSITEVEEFPQLLNSYGSKWSDIAEKLATKSTTMVKNYYQRNADKYGWENLVADVDTRLGRWQNGKGVSSQSGAATDKGKALGTSGEDNIAGHAQVQETVMQDINQSSESAHANGSNDANSQVDEAHEPSFQVAEKPKVQTDTQKPSIMSLLNNDVTPQKRREQVPPISQRTNNLSSLLNAPSSPVPGADTGSSSNRRSNSIESLLG